MAEDSAKKYEDSNILPGHYCKIFESSNFLAESSAILAKAKKYWDSNILA